MSPSPSYAPIMPIADLDRWSETLSQASSFCPVNEMLELCDALDPHALALLVDDVSSVTELDNLYSDFRRKFP